jgi:predicted N-formylglutamate amidohydrolase
LSTSENTLRDRTISQPRVAALVFTCEHGGNRIPLRYRHLFRNCHTLLASHRGYDPGALVMASALALSFDAPLLASTVSRLLVDLNRSLSHRHLHMDQIRSLPVSIRQEIVEQHYQPYRTEAEKLMTQGIARRGKVIHIACHSFTNHFDGVARHADIGLLYDPARPAERAFCSSWKSALKASAPDLNVRRNFPYQGRNDGLTSALRKKFTTDIYLGIELEINQKNILLPARQWTVLRNLVISSLDVALSIHQHSAGTAA